MIAMQDFSFKTKENTILEYSGCDVVNLYVSVAVVMYNVSDYPRQVMQTIQLNIKFNSGHLAGGFKH